MKDDFIQKKLMKTRNLVVPAAGGGGGTKIIWDAHICHAGRAWDDFFWFGSAKCENLIAMTNPASVYVAISSYLIECDLYIIYNI